MTLLWTKERLETVARMRAEGKSIADIAAHYNVRAVRLRDIMKQKGLYQEPSIALREGPQPKPVTALFLYLSRLARAPRDQRAAKGVIAFIAKAKAKLRAASPGDAESLEALEVMWARSGGTTFADFDMPYERRMHDAIDNRTGGRLHCASNPFSVPRSSALGDIAG